MVEARDELSELRPLLSDRRVGRGRREAIVSAAVRRVEGRMARNRAEAAALLRMVAADEASLPAIAAAGRGGEAGCQSSRRPDPAASGTAGSLAAEHRGNRTNPTPIALRIPPR